MATKLGRKELPAGHNASDFTYQGRPAKEQGDFGKDVGIADCACVNQFGEANNAKYYHGGVVKSAKNGGWFVYLEWGRMKSARSWNGSFGGGDFMFVQCDGESDARDFFAKQMASKNIKRMESKNIGGKTLWASKEGEDGYIVQRLATREKGLPDAYLIKDDSGLQKTAAAPAKAAATKTPVKAATLPSKSYQPQVIKLAQDLVGGVQSYTRSMVAAAGGVTPTMETINEVRDDLIPLALQQIKKIGSDIHAQCADQTLVAISKTVAALVPRPIPHTGISQEEAILSGNNILTLQQDLDAFEAALKNEDFNVAAAPNTVNPDTLLNAMLRWIDQNSPEGKWLAGAFTSMTNNRHGYLRGPMRFKNLFAVDRPDRDARFMAAVKKVGDLRKGQISLRANLQPKRTDLAGLSDDYARANVIFAIHGTRPVNIAPIMSSNFRLPRSLPGAQITGANFGHGLYFATDVRKSYGYCGRGAWGHGGGEVSRRGCFMFLCDMLMGDAYRAPSTGSWNTPPNGKDSVFGVGGDRGHALENDEHVCFSPDYQRIRYVIEIDWMT